MGKHETPEWQTPGNLAIIKGMLMRGDKQSDIAAYFGTNGGRIAEVSNGMKPLPLPSGSKERGRDIDPAPRDELPPAGLRIRADVQDIIMVALKESALELRFRLDDATTRHEGAEACASIRDTIAKVKAAIAHRNDELRGRHG